MVFGKPYLLQDLYYLFSSFCCIQIAVDLQDILQDISDSLTRIQCRKGILEYLLQFFSKWFELFVT